MIEILLIEDLEADARLFKLFIEQDKEMQVNVSHSCSMKEAIHELEQKSFDLIFLDLNLPDSSGIQTIINLLNTVKQIPIIVITGLYNPEIKNQCLDAGAIEVLDKKNLSPNRLIERIKFVMETIKSSQVDQLLFTRNLL